LSTKNASPTTDKASPKQKQVEVKQEVQPGATYLNLSVFRAGIPNEFPDHPTNVSLRQAVVQKMQRQNGNLAVQRQLLDRYKNGKTSTRPPFWGDKTSLLGNEYSQEKTKKPSPASQVHSLTISRSPDKEARKGLDSSMLQISMNSPVQAGGKVSSRRIGSGAAAILQMVGPKITFSADVKLNPTISLKDGGGIRVGPIQTLTSSERTGIYKIGNKVVAERTGTLSNVRDSIRYKYTDDKKGDEGYPADRPFYAKSSAITDQITSVLVDFEDQPKFPLPLTFGGGRLTGVRGAEKFNTSIGAKRGGKIITMEPFGWGVDWSCDLAEDYNVTKDAQGASTGKEITTWEEAIGIVIDTDTYAWKVADNTPPIYTFHTVDAAMTESASSLWLALAAARKRDPGSVGNIEAALKRKNPTFNVKLTVVKTVNSGIIFDSDKLGMFVNASKQSPKKGPFDLETGDQVTVGFPMTEIIDPGAINANSMMSIWVGGHGGEPILGDFAELAYPFLSSGTITGTSPDGVPGNYKVDVSMA
jgi:hypothetical protein